MRIRFERILFFMVALLAMGASAQAQWDHIETFDNSNATTSYGAGSFVGADGITWNYVASRDDAGYQVNGKGLLLRRVADASAVYSSQIPSGIGSFKVSLKKGFTGAGNRQVDLYINGVYKASSITWDNTDVQTFSVDNINVAGPVVIELRNPTAYQVVVDDISWTNFGSAGTLPEPTNYPTNFAGAAVGASSIRTSWADATSGQAPAGYAIYALAGPAGSFPVPTDGVQPPADPNLADGAGLMYVNQGAQQYVWQNLSPGTTYRFKIYPYTNFGANINYKTDGAAPEFSFDLPPVPAPFNLAGGNYLLMEFPSTSPAGTYPPNMILRQAATLDAPLAAPAEMDWQCAYNLTSRARFIGMDQQGIGMVNTSSVQTGCAGAAFPASIVLALNTTDRTNVNVQWTGGFVSLDNTTDRDYRIRIQYRLGLTGNYKDITDVDGNPIEYSFPAYLNAATQDEARALQPNSMVFNAKLPFEAEDKPNVQVRWKFYMASSKNGGSRPQMRVDDIYVTSQTTAGTAARLAITEVRPNEPMANVPFNLVVRTVDGGGKPTDVGTATSFQVVKTSGDGAFLGLATGTIPAGSNGVVLNNLQYDLAGTMSVRAETTAGPSLLPATRTITFVNRPILWTDFYSRGYVGIYHPPATIEIRDPATGALRQYNDNVTLNFSGPAGVSGTLTRQAAQGRVRFDSLMFTTQGTYTLTLSAPNLPTTAPMIVTVSQTPTMADRIIPAFVKGDGTFLESGGNGRMPSFALVEFNNLHPNTIYRFATRAIRASDAALPNPSAAGNNMHYNYATNSYAYNSSWDITDPAASSSFMTGAGETSKRVWVNLVPTSNAMFASGNDVKWQVTLANEQGLPINKFLSSANSTAIRFGANANEATGVWDDSSRLAPMSFVVLKDETGRVVSTAVVQEEGSELATPGFPNQAPPFYANLESMPGAWAAFVPNNMPGGVRRLEVYDTNGNLIKAVNDQNAMWPDVFTGNPNGGYLTPLKIRMPYIEWLNPAMGGMYCQDLPFEWFAYGVERAEILMSTDGVNYAPIFANLPASIGDTLWSMPRGTSAGQPISYMIRDIEHPENFSVVNPVTTFDAPLITSRSENAVRCVGDSVMFSVGASGSNLNFQWYKDGKPLIGRTGRLLILTNLNYDNSGLYTARVFGATAEEGELLCPTVETEPIVLYIAQPTMITKEPSTVYRNTGEDAVLEVEAHANGKIPGYIVNYEWYKNGVRITDGDKYVGSTTERLRIRNLDAGDFGANYHVIVSALCGTDNSRVVSVLESGFEFDLQPQGGTFCAGETASLNGNAKSGLQGDISYQWMRENGMPVNNGGGVSGATTGTLTFTNISRAQAGKYYLRATIEPLGLEINSDAAELIVNAPPTILTNYPDSLVFEEDQEMTLDVNFESNSNTPATLQWYKDGMPFGALNQAKHTIILSLADAGSYQVAVWNDCDTTFSNAIGVRVKQKGMLGAFDGQTTGGALRASQAMPNPAYGSVALQIETLSAIRGEALLTDVYGREIAKIFVGEFAPGASELKLNLDGLNLSSGVYHITIHAGGETLTRRFVVIK